MSQHASSSSLTNRAYVLLPPSKRKSSHLDGDTSERTDTFSPKKRKKVIVDIKPRKLDRSRYLSLAGSINLNDSLRESSPTISDWANQQPPLSPTLSELGASDARSPLFSPTGSPEPSSRPFSRPLSTEPDDTDSIEEDDVFPIPTRAVKKETADLNVPGESAGSLSDSESSEDEDDVPVRRMDDFVIFKRGSRQMVDIAELLSADCRFFSASGRISAWREDEDEEEEDEDGNSEVSQDTEDDGPSEYSVELGALIEFNVHAPTPSCRSLDSKLYIRTEHAWYILGTPHRRYSRFYSPYWLQHRILHLVVMASILDSRTTLSSFLQSISEVDKRCSTGSRLPGTEDIIGRELSKDDVSSPDAEAYILSALFDICGSRSLKRLNISRVPLIRHFIHLEYEEETPDLGETRSSKGRPRGPVPSKSHKNVEKTILARKRTFLTPAVNSLAERYFQRSSLETLVSNVLEEEVKDVCNQARKQKVHPFDPKHIVMGLCIDRDEEIYGSVSLDGVEYSAGDVVMVVPDEDYDKDKRGHRKYDPVFVAETSTNPYANEYWFCQIQYFFRKNREVMFHAQWFSHGSKTAIQEFAHPGSLYYLGTCDDMAVSCIYKRANFVVLSTGDPEPSEDLESYNDFHCGLHYDVDTGRYTDLTPGALAIPKSDCKTKCPACETQDAKAARYGTHFSGKKVLVHNGITYHINEHAYVRPQGAKTSDTFVLKICQITGFDAGTGVVHVCWLQRMSERHSGGSELEFTSTDERELYMTDSVADIAVNDIDGICFVKHLHDLEEVEEWVNAGNDHFFVNQIQSKNKLRSLEQFSVCKECHEKNDNTVKQERIYRKTSSKLVGLELFAGAGGLGLGMELSGCVSTKYAVEYSPSAAATFQHNHPNATVFCQDTSVLLKRAVQRDAGEVLPPLVSNDGKTVCRDLPSRDENIDFIFGGPPCQSFSRANHTKTRDDPRSTMPAQMISWVEYYRPLYFLLENVGGLLDHKLYLDVQGEDGRTEEHEVRQGMVKFIVRALIALGYQVQHRQLQALQYGVPQSRTRVIFWGARRGVRMPEFPIPTHAIHKVPSIKLPNNERVVPITRCRGKDEYHTYAPHRPVTIMDAIGDLPPFDWENPEVVLKLNEQQRAETAHRVLSLHIPQYNARNDKDGARCGPLVMDSLPGYPKGIHYDTPPQNRYQKWLRSRFEKPSDMEDGEGDDESGLVTAHYTATFKPNRVEGTVRIPMQAGSYHTSLPIALIPKHVRPGAKQSKLVVFGRADGNEHFRCALTQLNPTLKNTWPLHPEQRRVFSVRECARAQGFPDDYEFKSLNTRPHSIVEDQIRQIGNAVAVPFARALGRELTKVLFEAWEERQREGSPEV